MNDLLLHGIFALGGGLGAMARHGLTLALPHRWPLGTLLVNILGCLALGLWLGLMGDQPAGGEAERRLVLGLTGGFTTFSSFAQHTITLGRRDGLAMAALHIGLSLGLCWGAFWLGLQLG